MDDLNREVSETPAGATPAAGLVRVKKVRGGAGVNHSLGQWVEIGSEVDVTPDMAARCLLGKEFELVNAADSGVVDPIVSYLHGYKPEAEPHARIQSAQPISPVGSTARAASMIELPKASPDETEVHLDRDTGQPGDPEGPLDGPSNEARNMEENRG